MAYWAICSTYRQWVLCLSGTWLYKIFANLSVQWDETLWVKFSLSRAHLPIPLRHTSESAQAWCRLCWSSHFTACLLLAGLPSRIHRVSKHRKLYKKLFVLLIYTMLSVQILQMLWKDHIRNEVVNSRASKTKQPPAYLEPVIEGSLWDRTQIQDAIGLDSGTSTSRFP